MARERRFETHTEWSIDYQHRAHARGLCVGCYQPHTHKNHRGLLTWLCRACSIKAVSRQKIRRRAAMEPR